MQRLLEGIRRYGLENVSTLSKWIDIPVETARYMIWEELPKHNISVGITVNLPRIGLGRWMLQITPTEKSLTPAIENFLKDCTGTMYLGRVLPNNGIIAFLGIPFGEQYKLREQLEHLKNSEVIETYSLDEIEWYRNVSFNPAFFDFKLRNWSFDWADLEKSKEPLLTPDSKEELAPIVDYKDILILKELQRNVPRTLSKLSKTIGLDQHNLRYHYKSHARRAIAGYFLRLVPKDSSKKQTTMIFTFEFANEKALNEARSTALLIPFTQKVWRTERMYCWHVSCPGEYTNAVLCFVNEKFAKIQGKLKFFNVDSSSEYIGTIPFQLFNEERESWNYQPKAALPAVKK